MPDENTAAAWQAAGGLAENVEDQLFREALMRLAGAAPPDAPAATSGAEPEEA